MAKKGRKGRPAGSRTQYWAVAESLRTELRKGRWAIGAALPRVRDLADEFNVNYMVVFRALELLKKEGCISASRQRQLIVRDPIGMDSNAKRQIVLVVNQPLTVALRTPEFSSAFAGIEAEAANRKYALLVASSEVYKRSIPQFVLHLPVHGTLVAGPTNDDLLPAYEKLGGPVVLLDQPGAGFKVSSVSVDNEAAARDAVQHLAALGHKHIAFLRRVNPRLLSVDPDSKERQRGFKKGMQDAGLRVKANSILSMMGAENANSACIQTVFKSKPRITAVLCADGGGAALYLKAAQDRLCKVPGDLSIAAFQCKTAKTSIGGPRIDFREMGERAISLFEGNPTAATHLKIPARWDSGKTVGPAS